MEQLSRESGGYVTSDDFFLRGQQRAQRSTYNRIRQHVEMYVDFDGSIRGSERVFVNTEENEHIALVGQRSRNSGYEYDARERRS